MQFDDHRMYGGVNWLLRVMRRLARLPDTHRYTLGVLVRCASEVWNMRVRWKHSWLRNDQSDDSTIVQVEETFNGLLAREIAVKALPMVIGRVDYCSRSRMPNERSGSTGRTWRATTQSAVSSLP